MGQIVLPPPAPKKGKGTKFDHFAAWARKQGIAGATITDLWYWSQHTPNVDPYLWTSVLIHESGAKHLKDNGQIVSSGQAVGIGQIALSWIGQPIPWNPNRKFTGDNNPETGIGNYGVNLRFSAFLWGDAVSKYGWQKAYTQGYNPNDPNNQKAWAGIQKTYGSRPAGNPPIGSPSQGPADTSAKSEQGTTTTAPVFKDPYVAGVDKQNKFHFTNDPNKALLYDGAPLTRSNFLTLKDQLTSHYVSYTGQRPSNHQIQNYLKNGWSTYTLDNLLSKGHNFKKSPIYKQYSANLTAAVKDLLPKGAKVPDELLRQAVVNNWDANAVATKLRGLPGYLNSNEYGGNVATLLNTYQSIMGTPNSQALITIHDAALAGWNSDQLASYLRSQKGYTQSQEYQSKTVSFLQALGLITGQQVTASPGATIPNAALAPYSGPPLPADKRVQGKPGISASPSGLGFTLA